MISLLPRSIRTLFTSSSLHATPPTDSLPPTTQTAIFAAGCFWGVEHLYRQHFPASRGLLDARVGYIGGDTANPSYRAVCGGRTGHAEAVLLRFDPARVRYADLLEFFFRMHDPTTADAQGPDRGSQYRSGVFYGDEEQKRVAEEVRAKVAEQWWGGSANGKVVTELVRAGRWWDAEDYHQEYLGKNPGGYECPSHYVRSFPPLKD